jgi:hypothetical protein
MWTDVGGAATLGTLIHSLGCTFLTVGGHDLGFASVSEVPAPRKGDLARVEEDVRSDSVWFDRETRQVALVAEFERYSGKHKDLSPKVETLLLAQQRWGVSGYASLLLAYWSVGLVTLPDHDLACGASHARGFHARRGRARARQPQGAGPVLPVRRPRQGQDGLLRLENILPARRDHDDQVLRPTS